MLALKRKNCQGLNEPHRFHQQAGFAVQFILIWAMSDPLLSNPFLIADFARPARHAPLFWPGLDRCATLGLRCAVGHGKPTRLTVTHRVGLFGTQCFDRFQPGGPAGRIQPEEDADGSREQGG